MAGKIDKVKGQIKDTVGKATGNNRLRAEGKFDKAKGHVKETIHKAVQGVKKANDSDSCGCAG